MVMDVAIVGLGPVGGVLANLLGRFGLSVAVFERARSLYALPRAVHFDAECMRVFQAVGIADELAPLCHVSPGMKFIDAEGRLLVDWQRPMEIGEQGWYASYRFHQPDLEALLRKALEAQRSVSIFPGCEVYAIEERPGCALIQYEELTTGRLQDLEARYVVGCDGARSLVRRLIGSELHDLGLHEQWLVFDALLKRPWSRLGDFSIQFCDPARPATYVRGVGNRRRWEIMLMPGDDAAEIARPENIWPLVGQWISPEDADIERGVVYTFHSVIARQWRKGRLLLAGDSAHQTPPFLGQGMCAGVRDAANLAWKLHAVLALGMSEGLLDTYQEERHPHAEAFIRLAVKMGGLIQATSPEAVRERDRQFAGGPQLMTSLAPRLGSSRLNDLNTGAGTLACQAMRQGARGDDAAGLCFMVVARPGSAELAQIASRCPAKWNAALQVGDDPASLKMLDRLNADFAVMRPDRYLLGAARSLDELDALWEPVRRFEQPSQLERA